MSWKTKKSVKRRRVLKAASGSVVGTALVGKTSARNGAKHSGYLYDPVTHEILGEVSGQFNDIHGELRGNLRVDAPSNVHEELNLNRDRITMNALTKRGQTTVNGHRKSKFVDSDSNAPQSVRFSSIGESIVGYIQQNGTKYAYSMLPQNRRRDSLESWLEKSGFPETYDMEGK